MTKEWLKYLGVGLIFLLLQVILFRHLGLFYAQPDIILIFLVWFMSRKNRTASLLIAALLGFLYDFILDLWGLHMFTKTLLVYIGYRFIPKSQKATLAVGPVFLTTLLAAVAHNFIFLGLSFIVQNYGAEIMFWNHIIGSSLYSATIASVIYLFKTKS
jgi:rod shape-determining protein MreD